MEMVELSKLTHPWMVVGDFNSIKEDGEWIGSQPHPLVTMEDFNTSNVNIRTIGGNMS